jgi:hypothetical protein
MSTGARFGSIAALSAHTHEGPTVVLRALVILVILPTFVPTFVAERSFRPVTMARSNNRRWARRPSDDPRR